ncbi:hypothetical protein PPYR_03498 [Photinus pyralis]|uniref:Uncharacterized protein n=1 Tax=Photinus pyralis TaxID=7054 RepID=A0A5N4A341_PHOPY|nr:hypothetical protein PPYR_03498 [Photinus pyralis]
MRMRVHRARVESSPTTNILERKLGWRLQHHNRVIVPTMAADYAAVVVKVESKKEEPNLKVEPKEEDDINLSLEEMFRLCRRMTL